MACTASGTTTCCAFNDRRLFIASATDSTGSAQPYQYDPTGRLKNDNCTTKTYDGFDRLTGTAGTGNTGCAPTSTTSSYGYDPIDRQTSHAENGGGSTNIHYDGTGPSIIQEVPASGNAVTYQLDVAGTPAASIVGSTSQMLSTDGNGNITTIVDNASPSVPACTARFDAFGAPQRASGSTNDPTQKTCNTGAATTDVFYHAGRKDQTTGAYQLGSRTYDPNTASFYTPDSYRGGPAAADAGIGTDPLTANTYTYVNGDPINLADPDGHVLCELIDEGNGIRACNAKTLRIKERDRVVAELLALAGAAQGATS